MRQWSYIYKLSHIESEELYEEKMVERESCISDISEKLS